MNYRALIKQKFPYVERLLRKHPGLMKQAIEIEGALLRRGMKKQAKQLPSRQYPEHSEHQSLLTQAKQEQWFDANWYSENQQHGFASEEAAFADYLYKSVFSPVSPSPRFDNLVYLKQHPEAYYAGLSPLAHYLANPDPNQVAAFAPKWQPKDQLRPTIDTDLINQQKIAICLHIFYPDFIDYYLDCLRHFPTQFDVFITVAQDDWHASITEKFQTLDKIQRLEVRTAVNRGRNFGPLLVEFGQTLLEYDLFCHLHSKKSLYSGRAQTQWADYLGEYLLRDCHVIARAISFMAQNDDCGLYYPTFFPMMPDWVNHWLKNIPHRERFYAQWGIKDRSDFLAYPVGGMFWAKPQALKPLLEQPHQYDDFPAEPLPNDGSELHALERCIGLLAEQQGYKQLFYYPELGSFTQDKGHIFSHYVKQPDELVQQLAPYSIISFDVFDTLIRRSHFVADYAKFKLGQYLVNHGHLACPHQFVQWRNQAEYQAREHKHFQGDVDIFAVYQQLATSLNWSPEQATRFAELEFAYDLEMIKSKDEMVELLNNFIVAGKTVYIISDTYYTEHQIVMMLRKAGVSNGYKLFVSSALELRKDNGSMWHYIKQHMPSNARFIHLGDNAVSDAQIPGEMGLANIHLLNPIDKWQAVGGENPFAEQEKLDEYTIKKWGPLISDLGRYPFIGE